MKKWSVMLHSDVCNEKDGSHKFFVRARLYTYWDQRCGRRLQQSLSALHLEESLTEPGAINSASLADRDLQGASFLHAVPLS